MRVYLDSSALLKRVFLEPESNALIAWLREHEQAESALATSSLAWVEVTRAVRTFASRTPAVEVDELVEVATSGILERPMTSEVVALARRVHPPVLRTLDALHLASALVLDVDVLVTYDARLRQAAGENRIRTLAPGAG